MESFITITAAVGEVLALATAVINLAAARVRQRQDGKPCRQPSRRAPGAPATRDPAVP